MLDLKALSEPLVDVESVRNLLHEECRRRGGEAEFARQVGVTQQWVRAVLTSRRIPRGKILDALGLEAMTVYRQKKE